MGQKEALTEFSLVLNEFLVPWSPSSVSYAVPSGFWKTNSCWQTLHHHAEDDGKKEPRDWSWSGPGSSKDAESTPSSLRCSAHCNPLPWMPHVSSLHRQAVSDTGNLSVLRTLLHPRCLDCKILYIFPLWWNMIWMRYRNHGHAFFLYPRNALCSQRQTF